MKGWIGTAIGGATLVAALVVDPATLFNPEIIQPKIAFGGVLLVMCGVAFVLGRTTHELSLSRHFSFWAAGLAAIAIIAINMGIITGTSKPQETKVVNIPEPAVETPKITRRKKPVSTAIYMPDTPKLDRIEKEVPAELQNPLSDEGDRQTIKNQFSKKDARLPDDWQISEAEKDRFKAFLLSKGLKYDPDTAFIPPDDNSTASPGIDPGGLSSQNSSSSSSVQTPVGF